MLTQRIYDDRPSSGKNRQTWVLPDGTTLGQYTIISMLREDNSSITYLARNIFLNYEVELCEHLPKMFAKRNNHTFEVIPSAGNELNYQSSLTNFNNTISALIQEQHSNVAEVLAFFSALGTTYCVTPHYTDFPLTQAAPAPSDISENWLHPVLSSLLKSIQYLNKIGIGHSDINIKRILITETGAPLLPNFAFLQTANKEENALPALGELCYRLIRGESSGVTGGLYAYKPLSSDSTLSGRFSPAFLKGIDKALAPHSESRWKSAEEWLEALENATSTGITGSAKRPSVTVEEGVIPIITVTLKANTPEPHTIEDIKAITPASHNGIIEVPITRTPDPISRDDSPFPSYQAETNHSDQLPDIPKDKDNTDMPETSISDKVIEVPVERDYTDLPETSISQEEQPPLPELPENQHVDVKEFTFTHVSIDESIQPIPMPPPVDADENDITLTPPPGQACPPMPQPQNQKQGYPNIKVEEFGISPTTTAQRLSPEQQEVTPRAGAKVQIEDIGMSVTSSSADFNPHPADLSADSSIKVDDLPIGNSRPVPNQPVIPVDGPTPQKKKGCLNLFLLLVLLLLIALGVVYFVKGSEFIIEQINNLRSELETWLNSL